MRAFQGIYSQGTVYNILASKGTIFIHRIQNIFTDWQTRAQQKGYKICRKGASSGTMYEKESKQGHNLCRKEGAGNVVHFASALTLIASFAMLSYCYFLANKGTVKAEGI